MNRFTRLLIVPAMLGAALSAPLYAEAQHRGGNGNGSPTRGGMTTRPNQSSATRPGGNSGSRPTMSTQQTNTRPTQSTGATSVRREPVTATPATRPGSQSSGNINTGGQRPNTRPEGNGTTRPGSGNTRPGNQGNHGNNRPGTGHNPGHPGGSVNRPGGHTPPTPGVAPGRPGGNSVPRPGGWATVNRPHYNYRNPGYRPPRPGGGYWGAPLPNPYRISYWAPPVPRYVQVLPTVPSIGTILGLTFGSFIDAGINSLYNAGYSVNGYYNDAIYLNNVRQLGYLWPEVIVRYDDGLMCGTQFYNWSAVADQNMYYNLYNQLTASYGNPVEITYSSGGPRATWWAGGNTGYITLSYGYGASATGVNNYYTSLTYSAY